MTRRRELPAEVARRAREFVAGPRPPVPAWPASSVVLVRDGPDGVETYVHHREVGMAFAGGMVAFPGGSVDESDLQWPDDAVDARAWAARLGTTDRAAAGFVRAAIRETSEETGLRLAPSELVPWAHWITPRFERRRFDTWFFVAAAPPGQDPRNVSGEASSVAWIRPADAIGQAERGAWEMLPPTWDVLSQLAGFHSVREVLEAERQVEPIMPGWVDDGQAVRVLLPGDPLYPGDDPGELYPGDDPGGTP